MLRHDSASSGLLGDSKLLKAGFSPSATLKRLLERDEENPGLRLRSSGMEKDLREARSVTSEMLACAAEGAVARYLYRELLEVSDTADQCASTRPTFAIAG